MPRAKRVLDGNGKYYGHAFDCPGCGHAHRVTVEPSPDGHPWPIWTFNWDLDRPTFYPSIKVVGGPEHARTCCHSFVTDGRIKFLEDCTHDLAGRTVDLPEIE